MSRRGNKEYYQSPLTEIWNLPEVIGIIALQHFKLGHSAIDGNPLRPPKEYA